MTSAAAPALAERLKPCGPVLDAKAAERARTAVQRRAEADGWATVLEAAWPALAPVFAASPYLAGLARRDPARLGRILSGAPEATLDAVLAGAQGAGAAPDLAAGKATLRRLKAELHLLTALCDLGGVWNLDEVTGALTRFADAALGAALRLAAQGEVERGRLVASLDDANGPVPGLFAMALGKHGAFELNYSSDIDVSIFYEPAAMRMTEGHEPQAVGPAPDPDPGRHPAIADRGRLCVPCRSAPAARSVLHPRRRAGGGGPRLLRERRAELGAGGDDQGPRRGGGHCAGGGFRRGVAALHLAAAPGLRRHRRHPVDQAPDPRAQGGRAADRPRRQPQARRRRHPRDRILRPDPAADLRRPRLRPAFAPHAGRPGRAGGGRIRLRRGGAGADGRL